MKKLFAVFLALLMTSFAAYASEETHTHCVCGDTACTEKHEETGSVTWHAWDGGTAAGTVSDTSKTAVYLYLENDIEIQDTFNITNVTVYLCLNGKTLTINKEGYPAVRVGEGQKFVLCDCTGTGKITGTKGSAAKDATRFGAVNCQSGSSFIMYGGSISDNTVENSNGGGVFVNGGTFVMHGGFISNNKAPNGSGGAVSVENGKIYTDGGEMNGNSAINGGAIHIKGSTTTEICNIKADKNTATGTAKGTLGLGGAIFTETSKVMKIDNVNLSNNKAINGGGIYIKSVADNIYSNLLNIYVHDNSASDSGGGVYINGNYNTEPVTSIYDSRICKNSSNTDGGGIYAKSGSRFNLSGSEVSENTCSRNGGGIHMAADTYFLIAMRQNIDSTSYIKGNTAAYGGGISTVATSFIANEKCEIENNTATNEGGGVHITGDYHYFLILNRTKITKNSAPKGGGVYLNKGNSGRELEIDRNTSIIGNTSSVDDSANNLYLNNGKMFQFRTSVSSDAKIGVSVSKTPTVDEPTGIVYKGSDSWSDGNNRTNLIESDDGGYMVIYNSESNMHFLVPCYTVTADPGNGGEVQIIKVKCGGVLDPDLLTAPEHDDGYRFEGWYTDGVPYDFDKPVNENITLTAKWFNPNSTALDVTKDNIIVFNLDRPAVLFVASYNGSKLLDVKTLKLDKTEKKFITVNDTDINDGIQLNTNNATKITAFLWEAADGSGITDMRPLCKSSSADF